MRFKRSRALTALVIPAVFVATSVLAGCSTSSSADDQAEPTGGSLIYLEHQTFNTLYPPSAGFYPNGGLVNNTTDRLLYQNPTTLELEPWIATAYEVNDDATEYTFTLRDDVSYSDGTPLDAENVVANFDLYGKGDPDRKLTVSEAINNYDHGEVVDPTTVKFHFTAPAPGFAQAVSTINSGLVSNATLERDVDGFGPGNATDIIGSGPFVVAEEKVGTEIKLTAREDYDWAPESRAHQGRAHLDDVTYVVTPEDSVRVGALTSGQAHVARQIEAQDEEQIKNAGLDLLVAPTNGVNNSLSFRFRHPVLEDIRVRQAIGHGIDRQAILNILFTDSYPLATSVISSTAKGYEDESDLTPNYDPAKAKQLLDEAGWTPGTDGILEKDGERLSLNFNEALPQPRSKEVVTKIQEQLGELGIEVTIQSGDQAAQTTASLDQDTVQVYHSMVGRADYDVIKSQYYSTNRNTLLNYNTTDESIGDEQLEELLETVASTPEEDDRIMASREVQRYLLEQSYVLPLFEESQIFGLQKNITGFQTESIGRPSFYDVQITD
ncbi:TIGR04028 family ABC transporter substrate-binding protein [Actinomycetaceae bacterium L2_0104]